MDFKGKATPIRDTDLPRIGETIGVGEDEIHAFLDVETRGRGFDDQGRPIILFEPHVFYRELGPGPKRDAAVRKDLAYQKWGTRPYSKDSYPRLEQAVIIDETAALKSASWGLGQVMGFNHKLTGHDTVHDFVEAMVDSEANQLEAAIAFVKNAGLAHHLRNHDWSAFARGYNGAGYRKNHYHTKLANAYAKWAKIPDTPWPPEHDPTDLQHAPAIDADSVAPFPLRKPDAPEPILDPVLVKTDQGGHAHVSAAEVARSAADLIDDVPAPFVDFVAKNTRLPTSLVSFVVTNALPHITGFLRR